MKIRKFEKSDYKISKWSGGSTTELAIFPENADYAKREFLWRISSAKVELDKSSFTPLPGVKRIIMPLDGNLKLNHLNHRQLILKPFEQDCFPGDWQTQSEGKVHDFNVMCQHGTEASLEYFRLAADEKLKLANKESEADSIFLFCYKGKVGISNLEDVLLDDFDSVLIKLENEEVLDLELIAVEESDLLVVRVKHTIS